MHYQNRKEVLMKIIELNLDHGSVSGYSVDSHEEQIQNWFISRKLSIVDLSQFQSVTFLNNFQVDDEHRNEGIGSELLNMFIAESFTDCIILECDTEEENEFDLVEWYKNYGFIILVEKDNPIMILKLN